MTVFTGLEKDMQRKSQYVMGITSTNGFLSQNKFSPGNNMGETK